MTGRNQFTYRDFLAKQMRGSSVLTMMEMQRKNVCWQIGRLRKLSRRNSIAAPETYCFDSSQSAGEKTEVVYVCCCQQDWDTSLPRAHQGGQWGIREHLQRMGENGASEGSAQIRSAHWSTQETLSMGTHRGVRTGPWCGTLEIKSELGENMWFWIEYNIVGKKKICTFCHCHVSSALMKHSDQLMITVFGIEAKK